jgi:hypothetical protein
LVRIRIQIPLKQTVLEILLIQAGKEWAKIMEAVLVVAQAAEAVAEEEAVLEERVAALEGEARAVAEEEAVVAEGAVEERVAGHPRAEPVLLAGMACALLLKIV